MRVVRVNGSFQELLNMGAPFCELERRGKALRILRDGAFWRLLTSLASFSYFQRLARRSGRTHANPDEIKQLKEDLCQDTELIVFSASAIAGNYETISHKVAEMKDAGIQLEISEESYCPELCEAANGLIIACAPFAQSDVKGSDTNSDVMLIEAALAAERLKDGIDLLIGVSRAFQVPVLESESRINFEVEESLSPRQISEVLTAAADAYEFLSRIVPDDAVHRPLHVHCIEQGSTFFAFTGMQELVPFLTKGLELASSFVWRRTTAEGMTAVQGDLRSELAAALDLRNSFASAGFPTDRIDNCLQQAGEEYAEALLRLVSVQSRFHLNGTPLGKTVKERTPSRSPTPSSKYSTDNTAELFGSRESQKDWHSDRRDDGRSAD